MYTTTMRVLITGGNGFIGSHITRQLLDQGHQVIVYDNFSTSEKPSVINHPTSHIRQLQSDKNNSQTTDDRRLSGELVEPLTTIEGNILDAKKLQESLQGVDAVIHMASLISVEESVKMPVKYMENNVIGAATLLEAMRVVGVKKIVFSSSATVYGTPKSLPITEDQPISAANPYGASKIAIETLCESFAKTDGFDVTILRYFNPYGPGENHLPESHAIPNFVLAALEHQPLPLYWKGEQVRDFIYVEDLAAAHIEVLHLTGYNVFNVGTGQGTKIIDIVNKLSDIFGYKIEIEDKGERPGDVMANYASNQKITSTTQWTPQTSLGDGLRKTVDFFKQNRQSK